MNRSTLKNTAKNVIGLRGVKALKSLYNYVALRRAYRRDRVKYQKHSSVFNHNSFEKLECGLTLFYHGIEKGFLHDNIRPYFAKEKVISLLKILSDKKIDESHCQRCHLQSAAANLCNYFDWHKANGYVLDYFSQEQYDQLKSHMITPLPSIKESSREEYLSRTKSPFFDFAKSRSSVREFSEALVPHDVLENVINLANTAPSVCNRQGVSVIIVEDKLKIQKILDIQKGLAGYTSISQLVVLKSNRSYFYSPGERNQLYIDGGIYLMNLLYAFHYYGIAACTAHWGLLNDADNKMEDLLGLSPAEQVICIVSFGYPKETVKSTLSLRRKANENLRFI
ncbi:nitroreductase family protein [Porphyromonas levii]|uniref:nitroreductase family protein n=1 Tax=Porphyromonas levii TaxID=28114 RepID=UPI001B8CBC48|nr:nitroreductase family protein [Porphyromonas levii]MBR8712931.1 hypothetical protein [Porphyromonas levii]MBR8714979.1 hypothetical protein [Porphyromonas levii]MBR8727482.1 hypothetical protein [Porphyromonas levii]MBR8735798.1 hypothetical protein [Porphyromonas levii]MBR8777870.1 hypothetical protein [Porphyromonas levii]